MSWLSLSILLAYGTTPSPHKELVWKIIFITWFVAAAIQGVAEGIRSNDRARRNRR